MAQFKHVGFKDEKEWRLVVHMSASAAGCDLTHFRDGAFGRTPYVKIPLELKGPKSPLKSIVIGPSQNIDLTAAILRIELAKRGILGVEVATSKIPYRSW
jgi:hypothetical protein